MPRYLIIIQPTDSGYSTYAPDVPGCVSTGALQSGVESSMRSAIEAHLAELRSDGAPLPAPRSVVAYVEVAG
jgi:predicted RNase H-like HicB family nuclease